jgi:hypothetical protein
MTNRMAVAGPGSQFKQEGAKPAGFWAGYWHGMISPVAFVVSLFKPEVRIYETHNNGGWYDFGFILGASSSLGGTTINVRKPIAKEPDLEDSPQSQVVDEA